MTIPGPVPVTIPAPVPARVPAPVTQTGNANRAVRSPPRRRPSRFAATSRGGVRRWCACADGARSRASGRRLRCPGREDGGFGRVRRDSEDCQGCEECGVFDFEGGWTAASTAGTAFEGGWTAASTAGTAVSAAFAAALAATGQRGDRRRDYGDGGPGLRRPGRDGAGPVTAASAAFAAARSMGRAAAFAGTEGGRIAASASKAST